MSDIVLVPFTYTVMDRPYRIRAENAQGRTVREDLPVRFRDVSEVDAPVVCELVRSEAERFFATYGHSSTEGTNLPVAACRYRRIDGHLYRQSLDGEGMPFRAEALAAHQDVDGKSKDYPFSRNSEVPFKVPFRHQVEFNDVQGDNRGARILAMQTLAADLVTVNGEIYMPTVEPIIEVRLSSQKLAPGSNDEFRGIGVHVLPDPKSATSDGVKFRLDEWETALDLAADWAANSKKEFQAFGEVIYADSQFLAFDPSPESTQRLRKEASGTAWHGFHNCTPDQIRMWCDAEDIFRNGDFEGGAAKLAVFLEASAAQLASHRRDSLKVALDRYLSLPAVFPEALSDLHF